MFGDDDRSVRPNPFQLVLIVATYLQRKLNGTIQLERKGMRPLRSRGQANDNPKHAKCSLIQQN